VIRRGFAAANAVRTVSDLMASRIIVDNGADMKKLVRIGSLALVTLVAGTAFGSVRNPEPADFQGHRSSLRAAVTLSDGRVRTITLRGVGCTLAMCSRVRALDTNAESVWMDGLTSVRNISREADGVTAVLTFKDGSERRASIPAGNRVLYLAGRFGQTERLDLARVSRIEFE
jgi:hypothetical protein